MYFHASIIDQDQTLMSRLTLVATLGGAERSNVDDADEQHYTSPKRPLTNMVLFVTATMKYHRLIEWLILVQRRNLLPPYFFLIVYKTFVLH